MRSVFGSKAPSSKDAQTAEADEQAPPKFPAPKNTGGSAPDLASVPTTAPTPPSTKQEREKVIEGLIADRERARYTDQESRIAPIDVRPLSEAAAAPDATSAAPPQAVGAPVQPVTKLQTPPGKAATATADELAAQADIPPPPPPPSDAAERHLPAVASATSAVGPASPGGAPGGPGTEPGPRPYAALGVRSDGFRPLAAYERSSNTMMNRVASIDFDINSEAVTPADRRVIADAVKLAKNAKATFRVIGRSNDASRKAQNRATAVARELQSEGIGQDRIFVGTDSGSEGQVDVILDQ